MADQFVNAPDSTSPLDIRPVTGRIGGEVRDFKLSAGLDDQSTAAVRQALARHKVLFFRGQHHLDDAEQEAFAARFGDPVSHPTVPVRDGTQHILDLDSTDGRAASSWHTDVTFIDAYPAASILRGVTIPQTGGDTQWANTAAAYDDLPAPLKAWPTRYGRYIPTPMTMPRSTRRGRRRRASSTATCSRPGCTKPNIPWCGSIR